MGMTMAQKIIARASGRDHVAPGDYIWGKVDGTGVIGGSALRHLDNLGKVFDPERVYVVEDHLAPSPSVAAANGTKRMREFVKRNGIKNYFEWGRHGILHELFPDHGYCSPGDFIASVDSHSHQLRLLQRGLLSAQRGDATGAPDRRALAARARSHQVQPDRQAPRAGELRRR